MTSTPNRPSQIVGKLHRAPTDETLALVFPGQGAQTVGMGAELHRESAAAREIFQKAEAILELDLSRLCFQGPEEELRQTANAQPAIMATSLACLTAAIETGAIGRRPAFVAGHSLGEYTALVAAGSLTLENALRLVGRRGRIMQEAGQTQPGTMAALLGLSDETVVEICNLSEAEPCNYNSPGQIVVGGDPAAVAKAIDLAKERGARAIPLNVSGAFHTSLMKTAAGEFSQAVEDAPISDPVIPVLGNASGRPLTSAEEVRADLRQQMVSPVLWHQSVTEMMRAGVSTFIEVGPGRVLSTLLKRIAPEAGAISIDGPMAKPNLSDV